MLKLQQSRMRIRELGYTYQLPPSPLLFNRTSIDEATYISTKLMITRSVDLTSKASDLTILNKDNSRNSFVSSFYSTPWSPKEQKKWKCGNPFPEKGNISAYLWRLLTGHFYRKNSPKVRRAEKIPKQIITLLVILLLTCIDTQFLQHTERSGKGNCTEQKTIDTIF